MLRNPQHCLLSKSNHCGDRLHSYSNVIIATFQPHRSFVLTKCRRKNSDLNSRNYYDILGVERTATQKEIRKAFVKLSKEYHPDSNGGDKSCHDKFVKINEAFSILNKQSSRTTYDQSLNPSPYTTNPSYTAGRPPNYGSPFTRPYNNFNSRTAYQQNWGFDDSDWARPRFDRNFFENLRQRIKEDHRRRNSNAYTSSSNGIVHAYFAPFTIISLLLGIGILIHIVQWRIVRYSDPSFSIDPRSRSYQAYREWQRLSSLEGAESMTMRDKSKQSDETK